MKSRSYVNNPNSGSVEDYRTLKTKLPPFSDCTRSILEAKTGTNSCRLLISQVQSPQLI